MKYVVTVASIFENKLEHHTFKDLQQARNFVENSKDKPQEKGAFVYHGKEHHYFIERESNLY
jgi:hypothetical protein